MHPWYGQNIAKEDASSTMPSATPYPAASPDMDHPPSDQIFFNDTSMPMPYGPYYPQIFYDDDHHDHFHDHHHETITTTTTVAPPPPPSKPMYARYALRTKFWLGHLFFALWFLFYMVWLMMKSLGRHEVMVSFYWKKFKI